jgi:peptidoglycan/xylan/chitin deacetylase (PgdA/CDA1 family)
MIRDALRPLVVKLSRQIANSPVLRYPLRRASAIIMFHEVQEDVAGELGTGCSTEFLSRAVHAIRASGLEIVSLDQALERIAGPGRRGFVALTFDDGYRDSLTRALPVLEKHDAPFTVYVPTKGITRELDAWWLGLRAIFRQNDIVVIDAMRRRFECPNLQAKMVALRETCAWAAANACSPSALRSTFARYGVSITDLVDRYFLNADELIALSRHPLATIGSHTRSHTALSTLDACEMYSEIRDSQTFLKTLLDRDVRHLAYPFGSKSACGPREFAAAQQIGFSSAVTAINRPLFGQPGRYSLPRMNVTTKFWTRFVDETHQDNQSLDPQRMNPTEVLPGRGKLASQLTACAEAGPGQSCITAAEVPHANPKYIPQLDSSLRATVGPAACLCRTPDK